jgi:hypothetical protein
LCLKGFARRLAYGSCAPIQTAEATALQLATAQIGGAELEAICRGNAVRFLGNV